MNSTSNGISYTKLRDGSWGLRGAGLVAGATVTVRKRDGEAKIETVGRVIWTGSGVAIATIARASREAYPGADYRLKRDGTPGPVRGCATCRSLGRMCKQCYFDEFDC